MTPLSRRSRQEPRVPDDKWTAGGGSKGKGLVRFVVDWIKVSWKDVLALAILGAASQAIYSAPLAATRTFPITFNGSGDIVYPTFAYPERGWIISPALSGVLSALIPIGIIVIAQIRIRSFWDMNNGILGVLYSLVLATLFQVIIKQLIGGFRPYFLEVCQPDISRAVSNNATGLNGVGYQQIMYSVDVCTNPNKNALKNAMTSFPSGHSTAAFAGYVFLFLWMNAKLKVWSSHQTSFYWLALLMVPLLGAVLMAAALTIDNAHHWYDILMGSLIGTVMAFASYRICYAAIWDWRFNHIPLTRHTLFDYSLGLPAERMERAVFVRKLGWGRRRRAHRVKDTKTHRGSGWSDAPVVNRSVSPGGHSPRYPDPAMARGSIQRDNRVSADQMV